MLEQVPAAETPGQLSSCTLKKVWMVRLRRPDVPSRRDLLVIDGTYLHCNISTADDLVAI